MTITFQVNTNLSLLAVDDFVNNEMVSEMFNILGFHIPNVSHHFSDGNEPHKYFDPKLYCWQQSEEERERSDKFARGQLTIAGILDSLNPSDVRTIIRSEDAASQLKKWSRLIPTGQHDRFGLIPTPSYADFLLHAWDSNNATEEKREIMLGKIFELCNKEFHLIVPEKRKVTKILVDYASLINLYRLNMDKFPLTISLFPNVPPSVRFIPLEEDYDPPFPEVTYIIVIPSRL